MNSPYDKLIIHYKSLVFEIETLVNDSKRLLEASKLENNYYDVKHYSKLLSELKAILIEHLEGLIFWKKRKENYLKNKTNGKINRKTKRIIIKDY